MKRREQAEMIERPNGMRVRGGDLRRRDDKSWGGERRGDEVRESWESDERGRE